MVILHFARKLATNIKFDARGKLLRYIFFSRRPHPIPEETPQDIKSRAGGLRYRAEIQILISAPRYYARVDRTRAVVSAGVSSKI